MTLYIPLLQKNGKRHVKNCKIFHTQKRKNKTKQPPPKKTKKNKKKKQKTNKQKKKQPNILPTSVLKQKSGAPHLLARVHSQVNGSEFETAYTERTNGYHEYKWHNPRNILKFYKV